MIENRSVVVAVFKGGGQVGNRLAYCYPWLQLARGDTFSQRAQSVLTYYYIFWLGNAGTLPVVVRHMLFKQHGFLRVRGVRKSPVSINVVAEANKKNTLATLGYAIIGGVQYS